MKVSIFNRKFRKIKSFLPSVCKFGIDGCYVTKYMAVQGEYSGCLGNSSLTKTKVLT